MAHFDIEGVYSLWNAAPVAIQAWNWLENARFAVQLVLLVGLIIAGGFVIYRSIQKLAERDSQS
jgi:hypothetical protein